MSDDFDERIMMQGLSHAVSTKDLVSIDQTDLNNEFASQAARYAYFAVQCAMARCARDMAEKVYKEDAAAAFVEYKNDPEMIPEGSRTVTDGLANMLVATDENCARLKNAHIEAEQEFRVLEALVRALDMRANMLISLGAQLRSEADMDGMHISKRDPGDAARAAIAKRSRS